MSTPQWDAICVGAGITSLAFAAHVVAWRPGARVLVVDKHSVAGGYASAFRRPKIGAQFECSLHKLSGTGPGGNLRRIFGVLGLDRELDMVVPQDYFHAHLPGASLGLSNQPAALLAALSERFPAEAAALRAFMDEVEVHGKNGYFMHQMLEGSYAPDLKQLRHAHANLKGINVTDALSLRFSDPYLREILAAPGIYVGGYPEDLGYLYYLHVVYATLHMGNAYVRGGAQHLSDTLAARIRAAGGEVLLGTTVKRILVDANQQATGIETTRGRFLSENVFINASPHYALEHLFDDTPALARVREKSAALRPSRATTTVYLTTDTAPAALGLISSESMLFGLGQDDGVAARRAADASDGDPALGEQAFWEASAMEVTNYHALDPAAGQVVCLNVLDNMAHWPKRRSPDYRQKKARAEAALLGRLYAAYPQMQGHVLSTEVASPRTYERFTNNTDGAGYGAMVGPDASAFSFHRNFPISGVQFLSAWVAGPSYEASFGYAEVKSRQWIRQLRLQHHVEGRRRNLVGVA
ncbi:NAD(P)/FAD-dependent oxidoreductase [Zoogloeaceae bacterium G21618-S1]|nr:NAD(P)/FAD-dependent oxidoreductase [Zoogloeaceae bacterium G21618-S1]